MRSLVAMLAVFAALVAACDRASTSRPATPSSPAGQQVAPSRTPEPTRPAASPRSTPTAMASIKIGGIFNLTGAMAPLDRPAAKGARLAVKEINTAGGILGRPLDLVVRDGKTERDAVITEVARLIEGDGAVAVVGLSDTDFVLAAGPITQRAGVPFITVGATSPRLPGQVGDVLFLAAFGDNVQAAAGAEFAARQLNLKTAYLLWDRSTEYTTVLARYFKERWTELAGKDALLGEDTYETDRTDVSVQIARIKALPRRPDFLYLSANPETVGAIVKQVRDAGLEMPIVGGDGFDTPDLVTEAGPRASDNVYFTTHAFVDPGAPSEALRRFLDAYRAEHKVAPENAFAALGYDSVKLLADAIKRAASTRGRAVREALEATREFPAATGRISYGPGAHIPLKSVTVIRLVDGRPNLAAEILPAKAPAP